MRTRRSSADQQSRPTRGGAAVLFVHTPSPRSGCVSVRSAPLQFSLSGFQETTLFGETGVTVEGTNGDVTVESVGGSVIPKRCCTIYDLIPEGTQRSAITAYDLQHPISLSYNFTSEPATKVEAHP